jgi:hypothetical protein
LNSKVFGTTHVDEVSDMGDVLDVLGIVKLARRIPLNQLVQRSPQSSASVIEVLQQLQARNLVDVKGELPLPTDDLASTADTVIEITKKGMFESE